MTSVEFRTKPVRDAASAEDGARVLVDRLWPRGVSKERAALDAWAKDLAPSTALRRAFHGGGIDFPQFEERYRAELAESAAPASFLDECTEPVVTLLYGAADHHRNHAQVLQAFLEDLRDR